MLTGPDVSRYQPTWSPSPDDAFVFVKATEGRSVINSSMPGQVQVARIAGLVVGFYHFLWPDNAIAQADYFVANALVEPGDLLVVDWERTREDTVPSEADKDAFIAEVRRLLPDHRVGLYVNASMWNASHKQAGDFLWVAHYGVTKPNVHEPWTFWQWTDTPIDQNVSRFTTQESLRSWAEALIEEDTMALSDAERLALIRDIAAEVRKSIPTAGDIAREVLDSKTSDMIPVADRRGKIRPFVALAEIYKAVGAKP